MGCKIAIMGATGAVGQELLKILEERRFPVNSLKLLASKRSAGKQFLFREKLLTVERLTHGSFKGVNIVLASAGSERSAKYAPSAVKAGAVVIDNTSHFRMKKNVPLVVPEINPDDIFKHKGIIANPNCTTIITLMGLYPLRSYGLKRIILSSYQAVSGAGAWAIEEFKRQVIEWALIELKNKALGTKEEYIPWAGKFDHPIAFNLIPHIDDSQPNGYTKEEIKCLEESRKILHNPKLRVTATTVRVPVFRSHSISVNLETEEPLSAEKARCLIRRAKGVRVYDSPKNLEYPMPANVAGKNDCVVGRIREDESASNSLWL